MKLPAHIPELDGLRAFAIIAVLAEHSLVHSNVAPVARFVAHGWMGVDLFFVLSGFLITGILLDSKGSPHYFRNFYLRRALRIWPLYYASLLALFFLLPRVSPAFGFSHSGYPLHVYLLYLQNLLIQGAIPGTLAVTWSLAIEEQFYLFWPPLIRWLRFERVPIFLIGCLVFSPLVRLVLFWNGAPPWFYYTFTLARLDAIAMGALVAWWVRSPSCTPSRLRFWSQLLFVFFASVFLGLRLFHGGGIIVPQQPGLHLIPLYSFVAVGFAAVLGIALTAPASYRVVGRVLRNSILRYIGKISYSLYLFHMPIYLLLKPWIHSLGLLLIVEHCLLLACSSLSWYFFERPILRLKSRFEDCAEPTALQIARVRAVA